MPQSRTVIYIFSMNLPVASSRNSGGTPRLVLTVATREFMKQSEDISSSKAQCLVAHEGAPMRRSKHTSVVISFLIYNMMTKTPLCCFEYTWCRKCCVAFYTHTEIAFNKM